MPWLQTLLLVPVVWVVTALSWASLSLDVPGWVPYRIAESLQLVLMGGPFVALGWALERAGARRPIRSVGLAHAPLFVLAVGGGVAMGWDWGLNGDGALAKAGDIATFTALGLLFSGVVLVGGVLGTGVGVWLARRRGAAELHDAELDDTRPAPPPR